MKPMFTRVVLGWLVSVLVIGPAQAQLITNHDHFVRDVPAHQQTLSRIELEQLLSRPEVVAQLEDYGVTQEMAQNRIRNLTDQELQDYAESLPSEAAGGDVSLLGAALVVFIVFIVTDMLCATNLFEFVKCVD